MVQAALFTGNPVLLGDDQAYRTNALLPESTKQIVGQKRAQGVKRELQVEGSVFRARGAVIRQDEWDASLISWQ